MDEAENKAPEDSSGSTTDAAKDAALRMKADAEKAIGEIKGRGLMGFFSFDQLYFPIIARYIFIALCVITAIGVVIGVLGGFVSIFRGGILAGFSAMIGAVIFGIIGLLVTRIWFEFIMLGFKVNENLEKIRDKIA